MPTGSLTHHAVEEFETANGPADYALFLDDQIVRVIEAKKVSRGAAGILTLAERYAARIGGSPHNLRGLRRSLDAAVAESIAIGEVKSKRIANFGDSL